MRSIFENEAKKNRGNHDKQRMNWEREKKIWIGIIDLEQMQEQRKKWKHFFRVHCITMLVKKIYRFFSSWMSNGRNKKRRFDWIKMLNGEWGTEWEKNVSPNNDSRKQKCGLCHIVISLFTVDVRFFVRLPTTWKILNITFWLFSSFSHENRYHVFFELSNELPNNEHTNDKSLF